MRTNRSLYTLVTFVAILVVTPVSAAGAGRDLAADARSVVHALAAGDFNKPEAEFTVQMQQVLPAAKLKEVWRKLTVQVGTYEKTAETRSLPYRGYTIVLVKTIFKKTPLWTKVVYDGDGKIAGLYFRP